MIYKLTATPAQIKIAQIKHPELTPDQPAFRGYVAEEIFFDWFRSQGHNIRFSDTWEYDFDCKNKRWDVKSSSYCDYYGWKWYASTPLKADIYPLFTQQSTLLWDYDLIGWIKKDDIVLNSGQHINQIYKPDPRYPFQSKINESKIIQFA